MCSDVTSLWVQEGSDVTLGSDTASRVPKTGTRTGTRWQDASLTTPQICAERSWQDSLPNPPSEEALTPAITPFAPKRLQCCSVALLLHTWPAGMGVLVTFLLPDRGITSFRRIRQISVNKTQEDSELQWTIYWEQKKILFTMCRDKAPGRGSDWAADFLFVAPQQRFSSAPLHLPTVFPVRVMPQNMAASKRGKGQAGNHNWIPHGSQAVCNCLLVRRSFHGVPVA